MDPLPWLPARWLKLPLTEGNLGRRARSSRLANGGRRGTDRDPSHVPGPNGGHVQTGRDPLPNNLQRTVLRHGEEPPIELPHKGAVSNSLHATYSGLAPDTNNRLSR